MSSFYFLLPVADLAENNQRHQIWYMLLQPHLLLDVQLFAVEFGDAIRILVSSLFLLYLMNTLKFLKVLSTSDNSDKERSHIPGVKRILFLI
jgi:hypothetical protein